MRLVYKETGEEVKVGDVVELVTFTSEIPVKATIKGFDKPHKPSSSGFVMVEFAEHDHREYYVFVIGAEWIEREDRQ